MSEFRVVDWVDITLSVNDKSRRGEKRETDFLKDFEKGTKDLLSSNHSATSNI